MFQRGGKHVLKGATIKGNNMILLLFPLNVAPISIENKSKGVTENAKIKLRQYVSFFKKSPNVDGANVKEASP